MKKIISILLLLLSTQCIHSNARIKKMIVSVPIANLLVQPSLEFDFNLHNRVFGHLPLNAGDFLKTLPQEHQNPNLDSQLLFGEKILCLAEEGDWLKIQTLEQYDINKEFEKIYLTSYIQKDAATEVETFPENNLIVCSHNAKIYSLDDSQEIMQLSIGTKLCGEPIDSDWYKINLFNGQNGKIHKSNASSINDLKNKTESQIRENLVKVAKSFLGFPYCWGGASSYNPLIKSASSVDCSAFVFLTFLINNIEIPRNSRSQFSQCKKIDGKDMQIGDLIFFGNSEKANRIFHVLIYIGNNEIIECGCPLGVRIVSSLEKLGKNICEIKSGEMCNGKTIYFGNILN